MHLNFKSFAIVCVGEWVGVDVCCGEHSIPQLMKPEYPMKLIARHCVNDNDIELSNRHRVISQSPAKLLSFHLLFICSRFRQLNVTVRRIGGRQSLNIKKQTFSASVFGINYIGDDAVDVFDCDSLAMTHCHFQKCPASFSLKPHTHTEFSLIC